MRPADQTFPSKTAAERWLTRKETEILDGDWIDPDAAQVPFGQYAQAWIDERPGLRPLTIRAYRCTLRRHLMPAFGGRAIYDIENPTSAAGARSCSTLASACRR